MSTETLVLEDGQAGEDNITLVERPEGASDTPNKSGIEPFKAVINLVGCQKDANGDVVREFDVASFPLYKTQFDQLPDVAKYALEEFINKQDG